LINNATINTTGSLLNKATGTLTNNVTINNNTGGTLDNDGTFTIVYAALLNNHATVINDSLLIGLGTIKNYKTGTITNNDELQIKRILKNYGTVTNNKTLKTYDSTILENYNLLTNASEGSIETNNGFINNKLNATNSDSVDLTGITGTVNNSGTILHKSKTYTNNNIRFYINKFWRNN
jgi:hypothetical protein